MKGLRKLIYFVIFALFVFAIPAGIEWLTSGHWPKGWGIDLLVFFGFCAIVYIYEQLQEISSAVLEIGGQVSEIKEKLEEIEQSIDEIDGRLLRSTKSILDEY
jgi:hypothetical protein